MKLLTAGKRLQALLSNDKYTLVDIRTPVEFRNGSLPNATNLPLTNFANSLLKFKKENRKLLVFGSSSNLKDIEAASRYVDAVGVPAEYTTYENIKE